MKHLFGINWELYGRFFTAAIFNFVLVFTDSKWIKFKIHYIAIYLPAVLFFLIDLLTFSINTAPVLEYWGYNDLPSGSWIYCCIDFLVCGYSIICFRQYCLRYYFKAKEKTEKQRGKYVSIGLAIPIIAFVATNMIGRGIDMGVPNLGPIATLFFAIFVTVAIAKFDLFTIDAALAAEKIVSTITGLAYFGYRRC